MDEYLEKIPQAPLYELLLQYLEEFLYELLKLIMQESLEVEKPAGFLEIP